MPGELEGLLAHRRRGAKQIPHAVREGREQVRDDTDDGGKAPRKSRRAASQDGLESDAAALEDSPACSGQAEMAAPLEAGGGLLCGVVAAHAVYAGSWGRGGGADVNVAGGRGVMAPSGAEEELTEVDYTAGNVAPDEVRVHFLEGVWRKDPAGENAIAKAGGETFDLGFQGLQHVHVGTVGNVAVGPCNVLPCRCACGVEEAGLGKEYERALGVPAVAHVVFGRGDFLECAS